MAEAIAGHVHAPAATQGRFKFGATIVLGHALKHIYLSSLTAVFLPEIKLGLGLSATQVGTLASVQQFTGWFSTMVSGYLGDRFTSKTALLLGISLGLTGVSYFLLGIANSYLLLLLAMLVVGVGPSLFHPPALGALSRRFPDRRSFAISLHGTGGSLGEALGPLIAAGLLAFLTYKGVLQISAIPAIVVALVMWHMLKEEQGRAGQGHASFRQYLGSFGRLMAQRTLLLICLVTALRSVGQAMTTTFLPVYLREDLGYSAGLVAAYIAMAQVVGIGSQPLMGFLSDRLGHKRVLVPALTLFSLLFLLVPIADGKIELALVILALGAFLFSLHAILIAAAAELVPEDMQSTVVSLIYASSFVGALAPTVAGVIGDTYGLESTFLMSAVLVGASAVVLMLTRLPRRTAVPI
jgi:FSR family fosmidomycin resistance protein-like MFS transporter